MKQSLNPIKKGFTLLFSKNMPDWAYLSPKLCNIALPISSRSLLFCTYFIKETHKKEAKIRKKNGVKKKKKKSPIKKLRIKSDQNCDELGNIYDHMRDFFKFESSNVKENGKIENEFSCLSCLGSGGLWSF